MMRRFLVPALVLAVLSLSGCGIPGGIAQLVKTAERNQERSASASPAAAPTPAPSAEPAAYRDQPPPPKAAPRESIGTEQLPPPR